MGYKNILIISDFAYPIVGGTERHVMGLSRYLKERGFNVHILVPAWENKKDEVIDGVKIHKINAFGWKNSLLRIIYYFFAALKLNKNEKFDIIHGFYMLPPVIAAILAGRVIGKKTIATFFEPEPIDINLRKLFMKEIVLKMLNKADYITTLNPVLEEKIRSMLLGKKVTTVTNWVEKHFRPMKIKKSRKKLVLFVGRLCKQKGADVLIRAIPYMKKINLKVVFVGPPWKKREFIDLTKKLKVSDRIKMVGFVNEKELIKWYNKADVLVYPTIEKGGFGFTIIEAMACGTPSVGSDDMGVSSAVGNTGLISKRGNEQDLARCIMEILTDKKLHDRFVSNGLKRVKREFRREFVLNRYLKIYKSFG